jgi:hypothetical protein
MQTESQALAPSSPVDPKLGTPSTNVISFDYSTKWPQ